MELHPALAELACLLGTWQGEGEGGYPTVQPFRFRETATFEHAGKPRMSYRATTEGATTGLPLHAESGSCGVRARAGPSSCAYSSGIVEVEEGEVTPQPDGVALHLVTTGLARAGTAKEVLTVERRITVVRTPCATGWPWGPWASRTSTTWQRCWCGVAWPRTRWRPRRPAGDQPQDHRQHERRDLRRVVDVVPVALFTATKMPMMTQIRNTTGIHARPRMMCLAEQVSQPDRAGRLPSGDEGVPRVR